MSTRFGHVKAPKMLMCSTKSHAQPADGEFSCKVDQVWLVVEADYKPATLTITNMIS